MGTYRTKNDDALMQEVLTSRLNAEKVKLMTLSLTRIGNST